MLELDHLTVAGDVWFGRNITLRGTVIIVANEGSRIDLPDGSILDNSEWSAVSQFVLTGGLPLIACCRAGVGQCVHHRPLSSTVNLGLFCLHKI